MEYAKKLDEIEVRFDELSQEFADPAMMGDPDRYRKTAKARSDLEEVVNKYRDWKQYSGDMEQAKGMLAESDAELRAMAEEEVTRLTPLIESGALPAPSVDIYPLDQAPRLYREIGASTLKGKPVLVP